MRPKNCVICSGEFIHGGDSNSDALCDKQAYLPTGVNPAALL